MENNRCPLCGEPINLDDYNLNLEIPQLMKTKGLCFRCAFWHQRLKMDREFKEKYQDSIPLITPYFQHYIIYRQKLLIDIGSFRRTQLDSTKKYIAVMIYDKPLIDVYNNWSFQGIIPAHLRELFTPNGIILTCEQANDLSSRKHFTSEDLKLLIDNCNKSK